MAKFCTECGSKIADGVAFCTECGAKIAKDTQPVPQTKPVSQVQPAQPPIQQPKYSQPLRPVRTVRQQPPITHDPKADIVGTAYYFFMMLVYAIPIIGFIVCLVNAFSGSNQSKKNFSKAFLIWTLIAVIIGIIGCIIITALGKSLFGYINAQSFDIGELDELGDLMEQFSKFK